MSFYSEFNFFLHQICDCSRNLSCLIAVALEEFIQAKISNAPISPPQMRHLQCA
jgi:hypothetical protein